ncbi:HD domain-containing phosphohydrolase [Pseudomaricurvus sp.]|uniref:HD domain-containing phosphohydrolase n=1 Tax=Pseudomaricurvus sp. TaxID=2004510 RepID=UPI003F6D31F3
MSQSDKQSNSVRFTIRFTVVSIFLMATIITAAVAVGLQYYFSRVVATKVAVSEYNALADSSSQFLKSVDRQAGQTVKVLASYPGLAAEGGFRPEARGVFAEIMRNNPMFYSIYLGFGNGSFFQLVNLNSDETARETLKAVPEDRWIVVKVEGVGEDRQRTFEYYDAGFNLRLSRHEPTDYTVSQRPWYVHAKSGMVNKTEPYMFHALQEPGQTYSSPVEGSSAVVAIDIALSTLSNHLSDKRLSPESEVYVYQDTGEIIASDLPPLQAQAIPAATPLVLNEEEQQWVKDNPVMFVSNEMDWAPIDFAVSGKPYGYSVDYLSLISQMTGVRFEYLNGFTWLELVKRFRSGSIDVLQPVYRNQFTEDFGLFSDPFLNLPYSLVTQLDQQQITHVRQLEGWTIAIPSGWSIIDIIRQHYPQVNVMEVPSSHAVFEAVLNKTADAGLDVGQILHYTARQYFFGGLKYHDDLEFSPVAFPENLRFAFHPEDEVLRDLFNRAIARVTEEQKLALSHKWFEGNVLENDSLGTVPYAPLIAELDVSENLNTLRTVDLSGTKHFMYITPFTGNDRQGEYFAIVTPVASVLEPALDKVRFTALLTAGLLLLLIPVPWLFASPIVKPVRALALENEKIKLRQYDQLDIPRSRIKEIDELGLSMISMTEAIQAHEAHQIALMDSFIELIAQAIDDKSHYTAAHCERVPELAMMLAEKAQHSTTKPFNDFAFKSEAEWREFRVGAWLHDCGKITTPEHIVDKGSKLEVIYNRIHEIRTRFEVLWRDAEIHYWEQLARLAREGNANLDQVKAVLDKELKTAHQTLKDDFAFIAEMNVGGEFLTEDKLERVERIAKIRWTRHFSRRLGLSPQESNHLASLDLEEEALPCSEELLQDRPEHLIPREHATDYDPRLGINMDIPKYLYNQGELHNLSISRGTLAAEDRFKINEHMISTIRMLDALPFPKELENVPRYASTHHETLVGTGYPRKLSAKDLSIPERIMVLADIFEALTAADRPYKKAKSVSVAIDILYSMVKNNHVDPDVFELFLTSGAYLEYARRFLPEEQIDEVDIQKYLRND